MTETAERALRKDAELNRQRILAAAREVFAEHGFDATLHDVAAYAGVGVGTIYRRFPSKEVLIDALFERRVDELGDLAETASQDPDAWNALVAFFERTMQMMAEDRGFMEILQNPAHGLERVAQSRDRIGPLIVGIIERARLQGKLREDFEATDLALIQIALAALIDKTRDIDPEVYRRYLAMFLDGIRADRGPVSAMPVQALDGHRAQEAMMYSRPRRSNGAMPDDGGDRS
jgi:AcrR family transcriptional regulator